MKKLTAKEGYAELIDQMLAFCAKRYPSMRIVFRDEFPSGWGFQVAVATEFPIYSYTELYSVLTSCGDAFEEIADVSAHARAAIAEKAKAQSKKKPSVKRKKT